MSKWALLPESGHEVKEGGSLRLFPPLSRLPWRPRQRHGTAFGVTFGSAAQKIGGHDDE